MPAASAEARAMFMVSYSATAIAVQLHLCHRRRRAAILSPDFHARPSQRNEHPLDHYAIRWLINDEASDISRKDSFTSYAMHFYNIYVYIFQKSFPLEH